MSSKLKGEDWAVLAASGFALGCGARLEEAACWPSLSPVGMAESLLGSARLGARHKEQTVYWHDWHQ